MGLANMFKNVGIMNIDKNLKLLTFFKHFFKNKFI